MISPGVQNPHCTAPARTNAAWTSVGDPGGAIPSIVMIGWTDRRGSHHEAGTHQDTVEHHAARPALTLFTRPLGPHQAEAVAEDVQQALARAHAIGHFT